jgi:membrane-anchored glycerophosphoryl diester phosphodiesterase (GDPDase)
VVRNGVLGLAAYCTFLPTAYLRLSPETFFQDLSHNFLQLAVALSLLVPTLFLGFRLGVATESVVLDEPDLAGAFQRSFRMMRTHFERWFELVAASGALVLLLAMSIALIGVLVPSMNDATQVSLFWLMVIAATPIIQYAWTFFYLRLVEIDQPMIEVGPLYAKAEAPSPRPAPSEPVASLPEKHGDGPNGFSR